MLSGDRKSEAERVSIELGFDGHEAELLPHEKINALEKISKKALHPAQCLSETE